MLSVDCEHWERSMACHVAHKACLGLLRMLRNGQLPDAFLPCMFHNCPSPRHSPPCYDGGTAMLSPALIHSL